MRLYPTIAIAFTLATALALLVVLMPDHSLMEIGNLVLGSLRNLYSCIHSNYQPACTAFERTLASIK